MSITDNCDWSENIIIADADSLDRMAFAFAVNFERMIGRRVPPADMSRWAECVAMDGGVPQGEGSTTVVLVHGERKAKMDNFVPADFAKELSEQAFRGPLGEFVFNSVSTSPLADCSQLMADIVRHTAQSDAVKRLIVVAPQPLAPVLQQALVEADKSKRVTLLTYSPSFNGPLRHIPAGYSLTAALGVSADEIEHSQQ